MTYEDDQLPRSDTGHPELNKEHTQLFLKRLRKQNAKTTRSTTRDHSVSLRSRKWPPLRYYLVGEYGTKTTRPHYHAIMFNLSPDTLDKLLFSQKLPSGHINNIWSHGHVQIGTVTPASIHYVTGYVIGREQDYEGDRQKPFAHISQGFGRHFAVDNQEWVYNGQKNYVIHDGYRIKLPRYYAEKIYTPYERELIKLRDVKQIAIAERAEIARLRKLGILDAHIDAYIRHRSEWNHELKNHQFTKTKKF